MASQRRALHVPGSKRSDLPDFVAPALATPVSRVPSGDGWVHEIKLDGYRLEARIERGKVRLLTRSGQDWTGRFQDVACALASLKVKTALIDGEVVVMDENGVSSFIELVADLKAGRSDRMTYFAFDLLHLDGIDLQGVALTERKTLLGKLLSALPKSGIIRFSEHFGGEGAKLLANACELGLEGIISKRADKPYRSGRGQDWTKAKCVMTDEFVIGGYVDSTADKKAIGALALGYYERRTLVYAGRVGTGFDRETARSLWRALQPLQVSRSPFASVLDPRDRKGVTWIAPRLVAEIEYRAWTGGGLLRHASFQGLREDKPASAVRRPTVKA